MGVGGVPDVYSCTIIFSRILCTPCTCTMYARFPRFPGHLFALDSREEESGRNPHCGERPHFLSPLLPPHRQPCTHAHGVRTTHARTRRVTHTATRRRYVPHVLWLYWANFLPVRTHCAFVFRVCVSLQVGRRCDGCRRRKAWTRCSAGHVGSAQFVMACAICESDLQIQVISCTEGRRAAFAAAQVPPGSGELAGVG